MTLFFSGTQNFNVLVTLLNIMKINEDWSWQAPKWIIKYNNSIPYDFYAIIQIQQLCARNRQTFNCYWHKSWHYEFIRVNQRTINVWLMNESFRPVLWTRSIDVFERMINSWLWLIWFSESTHWINDFAVNSPLEGKLIIE